MRAALTVRSILEDVLVDCNTRELSAGFSMNPAVAGGRSQKTMQQGVKKENGHVEMPVSHCKYWLRR